jgi:replication-associated recombination protein RarA
LEKITEEESSQKSGFGGRKKKEIEEWLSKHRKEIESGKLVVLFVDECHLSRWARKSTSM